MSERVDVYLDEMTHSELEDALEYGDTKSEFAREAVRMRLRGDFDDDCECGCVVEYSED